MSYIAKDYSKLLGLEGLSDALLNNHFTLYNGYVTNTNKLSDLIKQLEAEEKQGTPEYAELKRRFGWEWNGMRLHELYFENLNKTPVSVEGALHAKVVEQFGSAYAWQKSFISTGTMRGIGWVILYYDKSTDRLLNVWVNEHDAGHLAGLTPLLIMDVFEHAFMLDYGLKRADYINTFMTHIDWEVVNNRF